MARAWAALACGSAALVAGCAGEEGDTAQVPAIVSQEAVGGIPGARLEIEGTVLRTGAGCLVLVREPGDAPWIIWPPGAAADGLGVSVDGAVFAAGDRVRGVGTVAVLADIPGGGHEDTYYGAPGHLCDGDAAGVVAFDNLAHVGEA